MKSIGSFLRESRVAQGISLEALSEETKIKTSFLQAIENEQWENLPEYTVVSGFVKNISQYLSLDTASTMAFFRRDYPPKKRLVDTNPAQPKNDRSWSLPPKLRFAFVVLVFAMLVLVYLVRQYQVFSSPPELSLTAPIENQTVTTRDFTVRGKTSSDAVVRVNNQSVVVDDDGNFTADIEVNQNLTEVTVKATSRAGKETTVKRTIKVNIQK